jgi:fructokinase
MTDGSRPLVVGIGEALWDLLPEGKQLGGAPANFVYHAQALGAQGVVVSCVGDDDPGREAIERFTRAGLDVGHVAVDSRHPTGTVSVELDAAGKPEYVIHENVAWDNIPCSDALLVLAARTDAVCFGSLCQRSAVSRATIRAFLDATSPECLRIFDVNLRQAYYDAEVLRALAERSNALKLNDEELPVVADLLGIAGDESEKIAGLVRAFSFDLVALTRGAEGSTLWRGTGGEIVDEAAAPSRPVDIADTVGAGDAFTGAMAMGWLTGLGLEALAARATAQAAYVCSQSGAMPAIPEELARV